jgi:hypothetical protein
MKNERTKYFQFPRKIPIAYFYDCFILSLNPKTVKYYRLLILAFTLFACSESEDPKSSAKLILKFDFLAIISNAMEMISVSDKTTT